MIRSHYERWDNGLWLPATNRCVLRPKRLNTGVVAGGAASGGSAVTLNAAGTETYHAATTSLDYTGITVAAGANRALILTLSFGTGPTSVTPTSLTAVWDNGGTNQSMSYIIDGGAGFVLGRNCFLFGLVAPTTGNKTLHIAWTNSCEIFPCAIAFNGVNQTGGATSFAHSAFASGANTVTITSATGNKVVACQAATVAQGTPTGTQLFDDHANGSFINAQGEYDNGAATVAIGSSGTNSPVVGVDVVAA